MTGETRDACWNRIGVWGDGTERCPRLDETITCVNCDVYAAAGRAFFARPAPDAYLAEWTTLLTAAKQEAPAGRVAVMVFRLGDEHYAVPVAAVREVLNSRRIHSIPHRSSPLLIGLAFVHGEMVLCGGLPALLGCECTAPPQRALLLEADGERWLCPVATVEAVTHIDLQALEKPPVSVSKSAAPFLQGIFRRNDEPVGLLVAPAVLQALRRSMA